MLNEQHGWTSPTLIYPPYVNFTVDGADIVVTVRGPATEVDGIAVCGRNCRPGDALCNNYCNKAPEKGPMADHPAPMKHHDCGTTSAMRIPRSEFAALVGRLIEADT